MKQNVPKSNVTVPIKKSSDIYLTPKGLVMLVVKILTYLVNSHSPATLQQPPTAASAPHPRLLYIPPTPILDP